MNRAIITASLVLLVSAGMAAAERPQIANVHPDFPMDLQGNAAPHIITGEGFEPNATEVWTWSPKNDDETVKAAAEKLGEATAPLPAEPPKGASKIAPLDVEKQVIVAHLNGCVVWVKTKEGFSKPYLFNVAKPFWLSEAKVQQGALMHAYGFGLRPAHAGPVRYEPKPPCQVVMKNKDRTVFAKVIREGRSTTWIADSRLVYFELPFDIPVGSYTLYFHNGRGGELGWRKAGEVEITPLVKLEENIIDARKHGAVGDGLADDTGALKKAIAAAGAGGVVFLPPGTYRTRETVVLPAGVSLRGAGRDQSILEGFDFDPSQKPCALVRMGSDTGLDSLALEGAVSTGVAAGAMVRIEGEAKGQAARNVRILSCRIRPLEEEPATRRTWYLQAINIDSVRNFTLNNNELYGSLWFWRGERMEIIRNKWHDCTHQIVVSIHGWAIDSLLDSNIFSDTPGRVCFYPMRHCYIRFNEVHQAFRGTWTNAEEIFLVHGTYEKEKKFTSFATGGGEATITDANQRWQDNLLKNLTVMIISGRGFGQYRFVTANTADTITVDRPWNVAPDATSEYCVGMLYTENAFYGNLNNSPLRMSLWMDVVANVVDMQRDVNAKGIDVWGTDSSTTAPAEPNKPRDTNDFLPAYYNMIVNSWMDGSMIHMLSGSNASNAHVGPPMFGNYVVRNKIRQPHEAHTGFDHNPRATGGVIVGGRLRSAKKDQPSPRVGAAYTIVASNYLSSTPLGLLITDVVRKTFVLGNEFQDVAQPLLDFGSQTFIKGNTIYSLDKDGEHVKPLAEEGK